MTLAQVKEFNTTFDVSMRVSSIPEEHSAHVRVPDARLRFRLIDEELHEFIDAVEDCNIVELVDALGDIEYVVDGAALVFGLAQTMTRVFEMVVYSNIEPERFLLREDTVKSVLEDLKMAILRDDASKVGEVLGLIKGYTYLTANYYDVNIPDAVDAIHKSNMTKLGANGEVSRDENNKIIKGPNYKTPTEDIQRLVYGDNYVDVL